MPKVESINQGKAVATEISGRRIQFDGTFSLGSSLFKSGHIITTHWNYIGLFGKDSIHEIQVGVIILKPGFPLSIGIYQLLANLTKISIITRSNIVIKVFILTIVMVCNFCRKLQSADPANVFC